MKATGQSSSKTKKHKKDPASKTLVQKRASTSPTYLELFQKEDCPFSHSVRVRLSELGLDFIAHSIPDGNDLKHQELVRAGGKDQVPFLMDHRTGVKLYDSLAILNYLDSEYGRPPATPILRFAQTLGNRVRARASQIAWAIRNPVIRVRSLRDEMSETWDTLRGSLQVVKSTLQEPVPEEAQEAQLRRKAS